MFFNLLWFVRKLLGVCLFIHCADHAKVVSVVHVLKLHFHIKPLSLDEYTSMYMANGIKIYIHIKRRREIRTTAMTVLGIKQDLMTPFYVAITEVIKS